MSIERFEELVGQLCAETGLPDVQHVLDTRTLSCEGFAVMLDHVESDPEAMYLQFDYGITTAGRTLRLFRLMLESNLLVYAQDQAQLGLNPDTGGAMLILRVPMSDDIDGIWLAETLVHYAEHGRYWRDNMSGATDEMFEGIANGEYLWLRV
jgi:Tir chaperone protein (CesT) family